MHSDTVSWWIDGVNAGATKSDQYQPLDGTETIWYTGGGKGTDRVMVRVNVSACNGWTYRVRVNGVMQSDTFVAGDPASYPYKTSVG